MAERRYSDQDTAAIFKAAAELQQAAASLPAEASREPIAREGMTLAQLQEIGREVGIPAELVARAAAGLERRGRATVRRFLGLPIAVRRSVSFQRKLTDEEWERLVVDLRETFDARGQLRADGGFRQWTNGNLQALLEPTASGHRLQLKTMKGDAYAMMSAGVAVLAFDLFLVILRTMEGRAGFIPPIALIAAMGVTMFGLGALRIPRWAKERRQQMEEIVARLTESTSG
jgi:hypothetical protein